MARHIFTKDQLDQYFTRLSIPPPKRIYDVRSLSDTNKLTFLSLLQKHQLCKVPWENIAQHYSFHHVINIRPNHLFRKIVHNPGVGGYCFEANFFFHLILWNLGVDCYMAGSRIWRAEKGRYGGWTHTVNIVTIAGTKYLLDGGVGPQGPHIPVPLKPGVLLSQNLDPSQRVWVFKHRYDESGELAPVYCFADLEFTPEDIEGMNFEPMRNLNTWFAHKVACVRFTTDRETDDGDEGPGSPGEDAMEGEIDGTVSLFNDRLKWRRHGNKTIEIQMRNEDERVAVLKRYFGIVITDEDREAIRGAAGEVIEMVRWTSQQV